MFDFPTPNSRQHEVVVPAPGTGPQQWAGSPSAVELEDGRFAMAYRVRSSGDAVVIAMSNDGVRFETVAVLENSHMGSAMTERPALIRLPSSGWRMYTSFATPGDLFWKIGMVESNSLAGLVTAPHRVVFEGDVNTMVKDPVVKFVGGQWQAWICCHLRDDNDEWDGMASAYATSDDGIDWTWHGHVLAGRTGFWDQRGARITSVLDDGRASYDGRRNAEENWFERTGIAEPTGTGKLLRSISDQPISTARYLDVVPLARGGFRIFYEQVLDDESHELRTELIPPLT